MGRRQLVGPRVDGRLGPRLDVLQPSQRRVLHQVLVGKLQVAPLGDLLVLVLGFDVKVAEVLPVAIRLRVLDAGVGENVGWDGGRRAAQQLDRDVGVLPRLDVLVVGRGPVLDLVRLVADQAGAPLVVEKVLRQPREILLEDLVRHQREVGVELHRCSLRRRSTVLQHGQVFLGRTNLDRAQPARPVGNDHRRHQHDPLAVVVNHTQAGVQGGGEGLAGAGFVPTAVARHVQAVLVNAGSLVWLGGVRCWELESVHHLVHVGQGVELFGGHLRHLSLLKWGPSGPQINARGTAATPVGRRGCPRCGSRASDSAMRGGLSAPAWPG